MFGIFFILAAHEHYSIDVFVAFYITSRLFLYYHTLANNQALMSRDSTRTRIWFPMFSYFESSVDGIIPNEYDTIDEILSQIFSFILSVKDMCMLTARRIWVHDVVKIPASLSKSSLSRQNSLIKKSSLNKHEANNIDTPKTSNTLTNINTNIIQESENVKNSEPTSSSIKSSPSIIINKDISNIVHNSQAVSHSPKKDN